MLTARSVGCFAVLAALLLPALAAAKKRAKSAPREEKTSEAAATPAATGATPASASDRELEKVRRAEEKAQAEAEKAREMLEKNGGAGKFEIAPESASVEIWRNSMQATWGDYDDDGDPDLYVANDWAPDNLMRNDGASGFTDVSTDAGVTHFGFAMGATWGDYDNDGREDMYVSNMYSKAGRRITAKLSGLRKDYAESAEGNWLYHQEPDRRFKLVSGLEPPALTVTKAGWSWGGKFADFDNDGFLDLYVLSGYFSAPKELSSELDL